MDVNTVEDEDVSFHLGEMFDSYEELEHKLEKFSKRSLVHYWRRDSRTVSGAHMKTARPICERLKYYSVKYACIYGGQKFLPRGAGRRQSQSIRTNCPAHIMLRASKDGTKLEVTSVNNEHNHEISEELFKNLPQERKLCGEIKQEVQDLMQLHIDRKRLKEYVRLRTNKILRSKDLFNIAAANKQKRNITPERAYQLFKKIHDIEKLQGRDNDGKMYSESEDEIAQTIKRMKKEQESPWGQDGLPTELEVSEGNDGDDSYSGQLTQEEVVDEIDATEGLDIESIASTTDMQKSKETAASPKQENRPVTPQSQQAGKSPSNTFDETADSRIWIMEETTNAEVDADSGPENKTTGSKSTTDVKTDIDTPEVMLSDEASHQLLQEQLAVLRAEKGKLYHETEMLKLKKDKLKLQMNCYSNEIRKQEMEKEKLRLEIKLLQSKVMEDSNDVSHYIFVP
ncbi:unnamed protein product [Xylocopa violacea]|uniref:ZSWIM3 N-terminal domain-containing protein n=1 Tax=Xylocopa violacea TaxID=135666 RepID=A0ABP1PAZ0_XYLVO